MGEVEKGDLGGIEKWIGTLSSPSQHTHETLARGLSLVKKRKEKKNSTMRRILFLTSRKVSVASI